MGMKFCIGLLTVELWLCFFLWSQLLDFVWSLPCGLHQPYTQLCCCWHSSSCEFTLQHVLLHPISLDFVLYSEHIFFLPGNMPPKILQLALVAGFRSGCHGCSSGLAGEYHMVFPVKLSSGISIYMFSLQSYCWFLQSNIPHKPCLTHFGCVCKGTYCEVTNQVSQISHTIFTCQVLKSSLLQQMALHHLQAVCQTTRIWENPSTCLCNPQ